MVNRIIEIHGIRVYELGTTVNDYPVCALFVDGKLIPRVNGNPSSDWETLDLPTSEINFLVDEQGGSWVTNPNNTSPQLVICGEWYQDESEEDYGLHCHRMHVITLPSYMHTLKEEYDGNKFCAGNFQPTW